MYTHFEQVYFTGIRGLAYTKNVIHVWEATNWVRKQFSLDFENFRALFGDDLWIYQATKLK